MQYSKLKPHIIWLREGSPQRTLKSLDARKYERQLGTKVAYPVSGAWHHRAGPGAA